ncbi:DNA cytosine methyltransferase [Flectobacillus longus]|uniref:DNA cytosine methyltransferase n=1 Tax=Flectobacillus longus TaxID=2984207 RepID=UPI0038D4D6DF
MLHISLFSGIGGFDLASEWMGWKNIVSCEINPFCNSVLKHYWPEAYHHNDIKTLTYEKINKELNKRFGIRWRTDDIVLTGGFPCQPYSVAGKRLGKDDERHLWPEMLRTIREIQPKWIVGENVLGLLSWNDGMVFEEVQSQLEAEGYEVQAFVLPACSVNAPHRRDRIWFVAYNNPKQRKCNKRGFFSKPINGRSVSSTYTCGIRCNCRWNYRCKRHFRTNIWIAQKDKSEWHRWQCWISKISTNFAYSNTKGLQRRQVHRSLERFRKISKKQSRRLLQPAWENFPVESPICSRDDGISSELDRDTVFKGIKINAKSIAFNRWRNESIKAFGNAVVPQIVYQIFRAIQEFETQNRFSN